MMMDDPWDKPCSLAREAMRNGRYADAITFFDEALSLVPDNYWEPNVAGNMICEQSRCVMALRKLANA